MEHGDKAVFGGRKIARKNGKENERDGRVYGAGHGEEGGGLTERRILMVMVHVVIAELVRRTRGCDDVPVLHNGLYADQVHYVINKDSRFVLVFISVFTLYQDSLYHQDRHAIIILIQAKRGLGLLYSFHVQGKLRVCVVKILRIAKYGRRTLPIGGYGGVQKTGLPKHPTQLLALV